MSKPILRYEPNTDSESEKPALSAAIDLRAQSASGQSMNRALPTIRKVPEIVVYFWILKLLTTAMGETTSDYLVHLLNPIITVALGGICLAVALSG